LDNPGHLAIQEAQVNKDLRDPKVNKGQQDHKALLET
jgi:hypothetical protein